MKKLPGCIIMTGVLSIVMSIKKLKKYWQKSKVATMFTKKRGIMILSES